MTFLGLKPDPQTVSPLQPVIVRNYGGVEGSSSAVPFVAKKKILSAPQKKSFGAEKTFRRREFFSAPRKFCGAEKNIFSAEKFFRRREKIFQRRETFEAPKNVIRRRENFSAPRKLFGAKKILPRRANFVAPSKTSRRQENFSAAKNSPARRQAASILRIKR